MFFNKLDFGIEGNIGFILFLVFLIFLCIFDFGFDWEGFKVCWGCIDGIFYFVGDLFIFLFVFDFLLVELLLVKEYFDLDKCGNFLFKVCFFLLLFFCFFLLIVFLVFCMIFGVLFVLYVVLVVKICFWKLLYNLLYRNLVFFV